MSLQKNWNEDIPSETAQVGHIILDEYNPYRLVGDGVSSFLSLNDFVGMFSALGRGAVCPILLSLVSVFQFMENIPDRVAAEWVVTRLDWKYALHLPLTWLGFDYSDLCNFRKRLLAHGAERLVFETVLEWVKSCGLLKKYGKQRSDSTHLLGCVERLSRLELMWETVRVALRAIQQANKEWYEEVIPAVFQQAYAERRSDWRLSEDDVQAEMQKVGQDGYWLLERLTSGTPPEMLELSEVATLRTVWEQQFERRADTRQVCVRQPPIPGKDLLQTPHDVDARWSEKRGRDWVGYKLEVTETAEEDLAVQFITDVEVVSANEADSETLDALQTRLIARDLKPQAHLVDAGYVSGANLAHSHERGIELVGPALADNSRKPDGYKQNDFQLDYEAQQAICPQGKTSQAWYERPQPDGRVGAYILWGDQCEGCPARDHCAPGKRGRTLTVSPYHAELSQRRAEQETDAFKEKLKQRSAIEGTVSELVRKHGARRARYRGKIKVRLQALFTGAAVNLKRMARALLLQKQAPSRAMAIC